MDSYPVRSDRSEVIRLAVVIVVVLLAAVIGGRALLTWNRHRQLRHRDALIIEPAFAALPVPPGSTQLRRTWYADHPNEDSYTIVGYELFVVYRTVPGQDPIAYVTGHVPGGWRHVTTGDCPRGTTPNRSGVFFAPGGAVVSLVFGPTTAGPELSVTIALPGLGVAGFPVVPQCVAKSVP